MTTLVLFAAMLCGQVQTAIPSESRSTTVSKNWYRIAIPGPSGDYHVWGTPEPSGGIRYVEAEQVPARARLAEERTATDAQVGAINYGVEFTATHATANAGRGNIQTNAPTYMEQADDLIGEACGPSSPSCPTSEAGSNATTIAAIVASITIALCVATLLYFAFPRRP